MASLTVTVLRGAPMLCGTAVNCTLPTTLQAGSDSQTGQALTRDVKDNQTKADVDWHHLVVADHRRHGM